MKIDLSLLDSCCTESIIFIDSLLLSLLFSHSFIIHISIFLLFALNHPILKNFRESYANSSTYYFFAAIEAGHPKLTLDYLFPLLTVRLREI
jgi:hypothetical protein